MDLLLERGADPYAFFDVRELEKHRRNPLVSNLLNRYYNYTSEWMPESGMTRGTPFTPRR